MDVSIETDVEITLMSADQLFFAVAQPMAGLAVDVQNGPILVEQKEGVSRIIHEGAEARLACAQLLLRLSQLRDILHDAELAKRSPQIVQCHVALAMDYSLGAVGTDHPVFDVIAWTATQQRSSRRLGGFRPILGMDQVQPASLPLWQVQRLYPENAASLVRKRHALCCEIPLPPAKMRDPLRPFQLCFILAKLLFRALAFRDVPRQRKPESVRSLLILSSANLNREHGSVLAPMQCLEGYGFSARYLLSDQRDRCLRLGRHRNRADAFRSSPRGCSLSSHSRLTIDVENGLVLVEQEESIGRMINEVAKALFARAQLVLCLFALSDVARQAQQPTSALLKVGNANLDREGSAVFAPVASSRR